MASTSSPPTGSETDSNATSSELSSDEADWHASRFRASWEPPEPPSPTPPTVSSPDPDEDHEPIELHRVASSVPPKPATPMAALSSAPASPPEDAAPVDPAPAASPEPSVPSATASPSPSAVPPSVDVTRPTASVAPVAEMQTGQGWSPGSITEFGASDDEPMGMPRTKRLPVVLLGALVGALCLATVVWAFRGGDDEAASGDEVVAVSSAPVASSVPSPELDPPASREEPVDAPSPPREATPAPVEMPEPDPAVGSGASAESESVTVALTVFPRLARVEVDGERWRAPFRRTLPTSPDGRRVVVSRRGYQTEERTLDGHRDQELTIRLERRPAKTRRRPASAMSSRPPVVRRLAPARGMNSRRARPRNRRQLGAGFTTSNPY